jgi:penicillin-binding protein 1A
VRLSRGKRGNPERFEKLSRYTGKKDKNSGESGKKSRTDRIFVSNRSGKEEPEAPAIITAEPKRPERMEPSPPARGIEPPEPPAPARAKPTPARRKKRLHSVFRYTLLLLFLLMTLVTGAGIQVLHHYLQELPAPEALERYRPMLISRLYSSNHQLIGEYVRERRKLVSIQETPKHLSLAIVAREDKHYYSHFGVDLWGVTRAVVTNLKAGRTKEGGSTLTQQLVKNLTNEREKAMERKIKGPCSP